MPWLFCPEARWSELAIESERREGAAEHRVVIDAQPAQQIGVDSAEVGGRLDVAIDEVAEIGWLAVRTRLHPTADREHRGSGAVVGALARVLGEPAAELRV